MDTLKIWEIQPCLMSFKVYLFQINFKNHSILGCKKNIRISVGPHTYYTITLLPSLFRNPEVLLSTKVEGRITWLVTSITSAFEVAWLNVLTCCWWSAWTTRLPGTNNFWWTLINENVKKIKMKTEFS